jgi:hypothetical protein
MIHSISIRVAGTSPIKARDGIVTPEHIRELAMLSMSRTTTLFPELRHLQCVASGIDAVHYTPSILVSSLQEVELFFEAIQDQSPSLVVNVLQKLASCPELRSLRLVTPTEPEGDIAQAFGLMTTHLNALESVTLTPHMVLNKDIWESLANLPRLRVLQSGPYAQGPRYGRAPLSWHGFPVLQTFAIDLDLCHPTPSSIQLLSCPLPEGVHSLSVFAREYPFSMPEQASVNTVFEAVGQMQGLRNLCLGFGILERRIEVSAFHRILALRELRILKIYTYTLLPLLDTDYALLATSLPHLVVLHITPSPRHPGHSAGLHSLAHLARGCPNLEDLGLSINTSINFPTTDEQDMAAFPSFLRLAILNVGPSLSLDSNDVPVARFLAQLFRNNCCAVRIWVRVETFDGRFTGAPVSESAIWKNARARWAKVGRLIRGLRSGAEPDQDGLLSLSLRDG